jgi:hypothetical protein
MTPLPAGHLIRVHANGVHTFHGMGRAIGGVMSRGTHLKECH